MEAMHFKLMEGVNAAKVARFVHKIRDWEIAHGLTEPGA
jgi:hypothetical protein